MDLPLDADDDESISCSSIFNWSHFSKISNVSRKWMKKKGGPITLAAFTAALLHGSKTSNNNMFSIQPPAAYASAPVVPIQNFEAPDQKAIAMKKIREERAQAKMKEAMAHEVKCEEIELEQGKAARQAYEAQYNAEISKLSEQKKINRKKLQYSLIDQGICPFMDIEGERQMFLFDDEIDLAKVPASNQQKEFMKLRRNPKLGEKRAKQRFLIKCIVNDVQLKGGDPLTFLEENKEKTYEIFAFKDKQLDAVVARYKSLVENQGSLSGIKAEKPFDIDAAVGLGIKSGSDTSSTDVDAAAKMKAENKVAKAEAKAAKEATRVEAKAAKEAARAEAKAAKETTKAEAKAAKEAARAEARAAKESAEDSSRLEEADNTKSEIEGSSGSEVFEGSLENAPPSEDLELDVKEDLVVSRIPGISKTIGAVVGVAGLGFAFKSMKKKDQDAEMERQRQFQLIMGLQDESESYDTENIQEESFEADDADKTEQIKESLSEPKSTPKKRRLGLSSVFSKKNANARETNLSNLIASDANAPEFSSLLAKILTFGAPGRFPYVQALPGGMPMEEFNIEEAKKLLIESRATNSLSDDVSAEAFACVVNCMIIDIIDLASSSLGAKEKTDKVTVDALNVVMDFMDHAASLFDAVADGVTITPVTYGGSLSKSKLEKMFTMYASSIMTAMDGSVTQDRADTLQQVFNISDKKAEGMIQRGMMKNLMNMMKDGEGLEGMEGMEGLSEMMAAMGGDGGAGMPGLGADGEISPEELKQSVTMMKQLVESGSVSKEELDLVRQQFQDVYGSDINDLIKDAEEDGSGEDLGKDGKELLDLFKTILKED